MMHVLYVLHVCIVYEQVCVMADIWLNMEKLLNLRLVTCWQFSLSLPEALAQYESPDHQ